MPSIFLLISLGIDKKVEHYSIRIEADWHNRSRKKETGSIRSVCRPPYKGAAVTVAVGDLKKEGERENISRPLLLFRMRGRKEGKSIVGPSGSMQSP